MSNRKKAEIEEALRREISHIVLYELSDPRRGFLAVTDVEIARDFKAAKVKVRIRGEESVRKESLTVLAHARGHIQEKVGKRLDLRYTPVLTFVFDDQTPASPDWVAAIERERRVDLGLAEIDQELGKE